jgi:hypothetical protein
MRSKKHFSKNNKTLKNIINKYIFKNDICCQDDIDRKIAIQDIFTLYIEIASFMYEKDEYLSYISNDLLVLIGYKIDLETKNDTEGITLWNKIKSKITLNKNPNKEKIMELLNETYKLNNTRLQSKNGMSLTPSKEELPSNKSQLFSSVLNKSNNKTFNSLKNENFLMMKQYLHKNFKDRYDYLNSQMYAGQTPREYYIILKTLYDISKLDKKNK